jgi:hypothetical protein
MFAAALASPVIAQTTSSQHAGPAEAQAEAIREHLDEADDLVDSLLRWRHVTSWSDKGTPQTPPPEGPANTLISIERAHAQKLTALLGALAAQVPTAKGEAPHARGDLRAHLEKAQEIARELQPPSARVDANAADAAGGLVTIDRTTLERLDVELDAMAQLIPRSLK